MEHSPLNMRDVAKSSLDDTFATTLTGTSQQFEESSNSLAFAFFLALILVYLILSAQFESFRDPLIIMFTVPLALAGAVLSLWIFGQTLNIFSEIGIVVLVGIVTKNGILIVEFANQKKEEGMLVVGGGEHNAALYLYLVKYLEAVAIGQLNVHKDNIRLRVGR